MSSTDTLITMASWEGRFPIGAESLIKELSPRQVIMYWSSQEPYATWTLPHRVSFQEKCIAGGMVFKECPLRVGGPADDWAVIKDVIISLVASGSRVTVDLTTMPREIIWWTFWLCEHQRAIIDYVYFRPDHYGSWLSRDPQSPRLVFRMSGVSRISRRTALVILAGYDIERSQQLFRYFEPSITLIGLQSDSVDPMNAEQMAQHKQSFADDSSVHFFEADAYAADHGQTAIETAITDPRQSYNIILASLGPKLSSVALYRMQVSDPTLGLAYAPASEFSKDYSTGIGEALRGVLQRP